MPPPGEPKTLSLAEGRRRGLVVDIDPNPPYLERIESLIDLPAIRAAGFNVVVDAMFGAGAGYLPGLLSGGATVVEELNGYRNPAFREWNSLNPLPLTWPV